jgi:hypothetical protein
MYVSISDSQLEEADLLWGYHCHILTNSESLRRAHSEDLGLLTMRGEGQLQVGFAAHASPLNARQPLKSVQSLHLLAIAGSFCQTAAYA